MRTLRDGHAAQRHHLPELKGYLKICDYCEVPIYLHRGADGRWRPYESWRAGNAREGQFKRHYCD